MAIVGFEIENVGQIATKPLLEESMEMLSKDPNWLKWMKDQALEIYQGKYDKNKFGGYIKRLPGWSEFVDSAKGDWNKSYFLALLDKTAGKAWNKHKNTPTWDRWILEADQIWNSKDITFLLNLAMKYGISMPEVSLVPPIPPTPPTPKAEFLGLSANTWLLIGVVAVGGLVAFQLFRRR
ncbi:MAG: hypothetical protein ABIM98_07340 [candidate division WOR-3 bacterium]